MAINFNIDPYYDNFDQVGSDGYTPRQKYHKILFRPGHAVQARELTQLQSILQEQVNRFGKHMFKEGSQVIPGGFAIQPKTPYVTLSSADTMTLASGITVTGQTSGVTAKLIQAVSAVDTDPDTIYVTYTSSGTDNASGSFQEGETLEFEDGNTAVVSVSEEGGIPAIGVGCTAAIDAGVYFVKDTFVAVPRMVLIVNKYDQFATADIGLRVEESIITPAEDPSLNDNANGTPNYAAPGAHRYQIKLFLSWMQVQTVDAGDPTYEEPLYKDFILLGRIRNGLVTEEVRTSDYSVIEKTLARRTFDESGNYTVRPFKMTLKEHQAVYSPGSEAKLVAAIEPSKAYVQGYEIETIATTNVDINKAREFSLYESASVPIQLGNSIVVENMEGLPEIHTYDDVELRNAVSGGGTIIGYARVRTIVGLGNDQYRLFLFDIRMNAGQSFDSVRSLHGAGTPDFVADTILSNGKTVLEDSTRNTMVYKLPFNRVRTLDSETDDQADSDFNYVYFANRRFNADTVEQSASDYIAQFETIGSETFEPFDDENWLLTVAEQGTSSVPTGTIVPLTSNMVDIATDSLSVDILLPSTYLGASVVLIAGVRRSFIHKTKNIAVHQTEFTQQASVESGDVQLERADGRRLLKVLMYSDYTTDISTLPDSAFEDVTEYYLMDDGQTDNYYGISRMKIISNTAFRPSGSLRVRYEYFEHSGAGDFFCVDSYANLQDSEGNPVEYEDFPTFVSKVHGEVELRSCIDFRPRVGDSGSGFHPSISTGADFAVCPEPATTLTTDIQYYLNRIDKVCLDSDGRFGVVEGVSALDPQAPADPKGVMVLYHLFVKAYTEGPEEVGIKIIDNKRYTMRDIGKLDRRIDNLEYYTSLSLLEAETAAKQIQDTDTGLDRFKNGFLVDSFTSHRLGDVTNIEYKASIDRVSNTLRPTFKSNSVRLRYDDSSSNLVKNGDLITLPILEEVPEAQQTKASGIIQANPYDLYNWAGKIKLSPSTDEWKDTDRRPNVVVNQEGVYDAMLATIEQTDALGTVWNEWQTNWTGVEVSDVETKGALETKSGSNWKETGYTYTTTTTTVTTDYQSRVGTETYVSPGTYTTGLGDRVVEINFTPFMRSRMVKFHATRMKPNTKVYAFFDNQSVTDYVRQITAGEFTLWSDTDNTTLQGINSTFTHPEGATELVTDANGELFGEFFIPNNSSISFSTGTKLFELSDDPAKDPLFHTTTAKAAYTAQGLIETTENVTISTRVPEIEYREVTGNRTVSDTNSTNSTRWEQESYETWSTTSYPSYSGESSYSGGSGGTCSSGSGIVTDSNGNLISDGNGGIVFGGSSSSSSGGSSKIVCTAMNEAYGFGSYRNKVWLLYSAKYLTKEHEVGYHAIFLPLVQFAYYKGDGIANRMVRGVLEHIARHRTIDCRAEMRGGKRDLIGRVERAIFEPICYLVGKIKGAK